MKYLADQKDKLIIWMFFICIFFIFPDIFLAQNGTDTIRFKKISLKEGLPQSAIYCIFQDSKGFMWFGTQDGLCRYNGCEFKEYKLNPEDDTTLSDNYVLTIYEDKSENLWIGTRKGLNKFDPKTETFTRYRGDIKNPESLSHDEVRIIYGNPKGILWIGTGGGGLNQFDPETGTFTHYKTANSNLSHDDVRTIIEDNSGALWIGTYGGGLNQFDPKTKKFKQYKTGNSSLSSNRVMSLYEDKEEILWIGTEDSGLDKFDRKTGNFEHYTNQNSNLSHHYVRVIFEDQKGIMWIGTIGGGLNKFDQESGKFISYKRNTAVPHSLSNDSILSIYEDRSGLLWIGTYGGGLNIYDRYMEKFSLYIHNAKDPDNSLSDNIIWAICEDSNGILWIGTEKGGLNKFDRKNKRFTHYKHNLKTSSTSLSDNDVRCIYEDRLGILWIGTYGGGVSKFDQKTVKFSHYNTNNSNLSHNKVMSIIQDTISNIWLGTAGGGLNRFNQENEKFKHYTTENSNLSHNRVFSVYEDSSGVLWIGTDGGGLNKFDRENERFFHYKHKEGETQCLSHNRLSCIYESRSNVLWIGTDGGLNKMCDEKKGIFRPYRKTDGLPSNVVYGILEDRKGNLWMSTNKGISSFNPETETFKNYDFADGLQCNEFNQGAFFKSPETGEMFFGGINGFNAFYPENIKDNSHRPSIVIDKFLLANKLQKMNSKDKDSPLKEAIDETDFITLSPHQNIFSFEFAALDFASPEKNKYKYKLNGYDKDWIKTDAKNRCATYTNIPAGNYDFMVKGSNKDGIWNEEGTSIKVRILPSWYHTPWAYMLYFLIIITILFSIWSLWSKWVLTKKVEGATKELNQKYQFLEKINYIVKSINAEMEVSDLLNAILKGTKVIKGVEKASALVMDPETGLFTFKATLGWELQDLEGKKMTMEEVEARYIKDSQKFHEDEDILIAKNIDKRPSGKKINPLPIPKSMLVTRLHWRGKTEAYFIFDNMHDENAFDDQDILLLKSLKEHFVTAFQKTRFINQLKDTKSQLFQSEKMAALGTLVAGVAHEINNPTSSVNTSAHNLKRDLESFRNFLKELTDDQADKDILKSFDKRFKTLFNHLDILNEGTIRIKDIVSDLKTFSRMGKEEMKPIKLVEGLQITLNLVKTQYKDFVDFSTDFKFKPEIIGNPCALNQVFMNIIINSCEAIIEKQKRRGEDKKRTLTIQTYEDKDQAVIRFKDNGIGMSEAVQQKMFDPFFTTKPVGKGMGLGLAISYNIIKAHHGRIDVKSKREKGTTITLCLPLKNKIKKNTRQKEVT